MITLINNFKLILADYNHYYFHYSYIFNNIIIYKWCNLKLFNCYNWSYYCYQIIIIILLIRNNKLILLDYVIIIIIIMYKW